MDRRAIVLAHHTDELTLLTSIVQQAGLLVYAYTRFGSLVEGWPDQAVNLVIIAHQTEEIAQAVHYTSRICAAPIIAITDFINDEMRMALYAAGAGLVLVRPYSPRLLMVQMGMMAQKMDSMRFSKASKPSFSPKSSMFAVPVRPDTWTPLYI